MQYISDIYTALYFCHEITVRSPRLDAELQKMQTTQIKKKRVSVSSGERIIGGKGVLIKDLTMEVDDEPRDRADKILADVLGEDSDHDPDYNPKDNKEDYKDLKINKKKRKHSKEMYSKVSKLKISNQNVSLTASAEPDPNQNTDSIFDFDTREELNDVGENPVSIASSGLINSTRENNQKKEPVASSSFNIPEEITKTPSITKILKDQGTVVNISSQSPVGIKIPSKPLATSTPICPRGRVFNTLTTPRQLKSLPGQLRPGYPQPTRLTSKRGLGNRLISQPTSVRGRYRAPGGPATFTRIRNPLNQRMLRPTLRQVMPVPPIHNGLVLHHRQGAPRRSSDLSVGGIDTELVKHPSSSPSQSHKCPPPVIELDTSPSPPTADTFVEKLSTKGCSIVSVPGYRSSMPDLVRPLPPNISITRTSSTHSSNKTSNSDLIDPALLTNMAKALEKIGKTEGSKRLAKFELSESQVQGLRALGILEM